jgi:hypothetical protein
MMDGVNIVEIQERLNSFLDPSDRLNSLAALGGNEVGRVSFKNNLIMKQKKIQREHGPYHMVI